MTDFKESWHSEFLLLFSRYISIVLFLWYKPPFIFSCIVSNKCRYSNEDPHYYQMKYKKRHSFHGYTLFIRRLNFIQTDLWGIAFDATKSVSQYFQEIDLFFIQFSKCFNAFQYNLWQYSTIPVINIASLTIITNAKLFPIFNLILS